MIDLPDDSAIFVVSDLHAKPGTVDRLTEELGSLVDTVARTDEPDLLVVLGDVVHGDDGEDALTTLERIVETLDASPFPVRYVPGNHDVDALDRDALRDAFGHDLWDVSDRLVFLDSTAPDLTGNRGEVGVEQRRELDDRAAALSDPLVFVHHPLGFRPTAANRWFHDRPEQAFCGDRIEVNELLRAATPSAVVNGHLHWGDHARDAGTEHFTVDSFNKELVPEEERGAYAMIKRGDRTVVRLVDGSGFERTFEYPD